MIKIILFLAILLLMVIPASAQSPPSGNFGYDGFDYDLFTYGFWTSPIPSIYDTQDGYLVLPRTGRNNLDSWVGHNVNFTANLLPVMRLRIGYVNPNRIQFTIRICGNLDILRDNGNYSPINGPCEERFSSRNSTSGESVITMAARNTWVQVNIYLTAELFYIDSWLNDTETVLIDYVDFSCIALCDIVVTPTPSPTRTPIIAPTGIPRTPTAFPTDFPTGLPTSTSNPPIGLTRPPTSGDSEPDCGVYVCGAVDLSFPVLPPLNSPTALSLGNLVGVTQLPLVTSVAGDYIPATPVFSDNGGGSDLGDYIEGEGLLVPSDPDTGEPIEVDFDSILPSSNNLFIAYIKGVYDVDANYWGPFAPLVQVVLSVGTLLMFIVGGRFILPVAIILIGLIRKAWGALMDLIPL